MSTLDKFRVIEHHTNWFAAEEKDRVTERVVWEGEDIDELSRLHPPSSFVDDFGHTEIEDGYVKWYYHFERQNEDGNWEKCPDPRHRRSVSSQFRQAEREEEAYLRQMFPGDFLDDSDEWDIYDNYEDLM